MPNKKSYLIYVEIENILSVENHGRNTLKHSIEIVLYLIYVIRFSVILYDFVSDQTNTVSQFDYFQQLFRYFSTDRDYLFIVSIMMLFVHSIMTECLLYFSRNDTYTWLMFDEIVIQPLDAYEQCKLESDSLHKIFQSHLAECKLKFKNIAFVPQSILAIYYIFKTKIIIWNKFAHVDLKKMKRQTKMHYFPKTPQATIIQIIQTLIISDMISKFVILIMYLTLIGAGCFTFYQFEIYIRAWPIILFIFLDYITFSYLIIRLIKMSLFLSSIGSHTTILHCNRFNGLTQLLELALINFKQLKCFETYVALRLKYFVAEHMQASMQIVYADREMWANILLCTLMCQMPSNVYMMYRIIGNGVIGFKLFLTAFIMVNQFGIIMATLLSSAKYSKTIHRCHRLLVPLQAMLGPTRSGLKMKVLSAYERITGKRIGLAIGPLCTVTYKVIFKILLMYFGYLFFLFEIFR